MKKFIVLFLLMFSFLFADTGDWKSPAILIDDQSGLNTTQYHNINLPFDAHVDINGIYIMYDDGIRYGGYLKVDLFDIDGTLLNSENLDSSRPTEIDMDGNDDAVFVVWATRVYDEGDWIGLLKAKVTTDGGENWSNTLTLNVGYLCTYPNVYYLTDLHANCDEEGVHVITKNGHVNGFQYAFLPNDADSDNDWVYYNGVPDVGTTLTSCNANAFGIEAINNYGTGGYDNIMVSYVTNDVYSIEGQISTDGGSTWSYIDEIEDDFEPDYAGGTGYQIDMTHDGDGYFCNVFSRLDDRSIGYSYRIAKGTSQYTETWSSPSYITSDPDINAMAMFDVNTNGDGYVDLVYPLFSLDDQITKLAYRKISAGSAGTEEIIQSISSTQLHQFFYSDITKSNDIFVLWRTSYKGLTGDIKFSYRDAAPIKPSITKGWSGNNPKISWSKPCFDVEEYDVYRRVNLGSFTKIATTSNTYYVDTDYSSGGTRFDYTLRYYVKAIDYDNNPSSASNTVTYSDMLEQTSKIIGEFVPTECALHNAYPNPFNPTTTIVYDLPEEDYVNISVYNSLGQQVAVLVDGNVSAGRYEVGFDGNRLSSGVYFVRMSTSSFNDMQKIVLMK